MRDDVFPIADPAFHERYEPGPLIGLGGMARVYRGMHKTLARPVAIKLLSARLHESLDGEERFLAEARMAAGIIDPHVVVVFDHGIADGIPYLVTELVEGVSLADLLKERALLPVADVLEIGRQVLAGLDAIHRRGIIHRDLKPENILVTPGETLTVKIADFGIAKQHGASDGPHTQSGIILGTPAYMAPEQVANDALSPATDLYALAVVLHRMITGSHPFAAPTATDMLRQHLLVEPEIPAGLDPAVRALLARGLRKRPEHRFASAREFAAELDAVADSLEGEPSFSSTACRTTARRAPWRSSGTLRISATDTGARPWLERVPARVLFRAVLAASLVLLPVLHAALVPVPVDESGWPVVPTAPTVEEKRPDATLEGVSRAARSLEVEQAARALFDVARGLPELAGIRLVSRVSACAAAQAVDRAALEVMEAALLRPGSPRPAKTLAAPPRDPHPGAPGHDAPAAGEELVLELAGHLRAHRWRDAESVAHAFEQERSGGFHHAIHGRGSADAAALHPANAFQFFGAVAALRGAASAGEVVLALRHLEAIAITHPDHPIGDAARELVAPVLAAAGNAALLGDHLTVRRRGTLAGWPRVAALVSGAAADLRERWLAGKVLPAAWRRALLISEIVNLLNLAWWREHGTTGLYGTHMQLIEHLREDDPRMKRLAAEVDGVGTFYVDSDLSRQLVVDLARALRVGTPALIERVAADGVH